MERYELVQKLLSLGPSYEVRGDRGRGVLFTVKGSMLWAKPKLEMYEGDGKKLVAKLRGNLLKTKFHVEDDRGKTLAKLSFPMLGLKKSFKLEAADAKLEASGAILGGDFACKSEGGDVVLSIKKKVSIKDKFAIETSGVVPPEVAVLAAVAVDQRFYAE
jgi:uncharacterized protein YxjI